MILVRTSALRPGRWLFFICISICLAFSAFYELLEWWAAASLGKSADAFLGTQGDMWDTHGDKSGCVYGGIESGLKPLLPVFDHLFTTLIGDLDQRGLLDEVMVIAMGEFGRTPTMGTQGSPDGRNHWPQVMSMTVAGGGFRHGQVIGASDRDGGQPAEHPVTPGDLAATVYHHFGVPLDATFTDLKSRPRSIVENGAPLKELI